MSFLSLYVLGGLEFVFLLYIFIHIADYHGNLALYKPTMQSSTYKSHYGTYATDGILHGSELCAWTNSEENSWWAVDLGAPKVVKMVRLSNPASSWHGLVDFDIRVNNRCGNPINSQL